MGLETQGARSSIWLQGLRKRLSEHPLRRVGPGLITGVADDDPSGVVTYTQAGAQYGLNMLWTMPLAFPLMAAMQLICARIGRVTGKGLAANIETSFPPIVLRGVIVLLLFANTLNIAADLAAMGEVAELTSGIDRHWMTIGFALGSLLLQVFVPYHRYVVFLKWLTVSLLAYAAVLLTVHVPWRLVAMRTLWPDLTIDSASAAVVVGVFGTTISPYLFFWQTSEEVEEMERNPAALPLKDDNVAAVAASGELRRIGWDTWTGMFYSDITAYFVILATAVTLHASGIRGIDTAAQAASALRPLAGDLAYALFSVGIVSVGLIGVPVLAGSGAYAMAEAMHWKEGLERKPSAAQGFYGIIALSLLAATGIQYSPISPMKALFWSAVINGVVAVPLMVVVLLLASKKSVMGKYTASWPILTLGWIATGVMGAAALAMLLM
ncbi:NRAMP family divalent metal transporter [Pandoraea cepalis]|uniref:Divalent metal cation transporter MntH n=1 Tax=Pandoraea cepalis TaxID=2508294 RepID=A0A5E4UM20_9BURK|nr:divalent metal cation transporter [Pandoraea cepalis]VVD99904.1 Divalent metal cation transporter MntH [Pandoraea cepalis]